MTEIEADLVRTYGNRVRVVERYDLVNASCGTASVVMIAILVGIVALARRWRDRYASDPREPTTEDDHALDAALVEVDD